MAEGSHHRSPQLILAETAWLQGFARKLVHEADLAEDLCQDTLAASLSEGGRVSSSRPWLARVARNLAISLLRREVRRRQSERRTPDKGSAPSTADVVAEGELQRAAVDALMALDEPYRSTLLLRFMKGLSYREIARRLDVPVETLRTRIKRGLALLRGRLDRDSGGRRGWLPPLGVPALPLIGTASLWGIAIMNTKIKVLAAAMLIAALFGVWYASPITSTPEEVPGQVAGSVAVQGVLPVEGSDPEDTQRRVLVPSPETEEHAETGTLIVRTIWADTGEPAAHVGVRVAQDQWAGTELMTTTGSDGTARLEALEPGGFRVTADRPATGEFDTKDVEVPADGEATLQLALDGIRSVRGIVVDQVGAPVPGARLLLGLAAVWPTRLYPTLRTESDGTFSLFGLGDAYIVGARAEGHGTSDLIAVGGMLRDPSGELTVRLVLPGSPAEFTGTVFGPEGETVAGAWVKVGGRTFLEVRPDGTQGQGPPQQFLRTSAEGTFEVGALRPGNTPVLVYARGFAAWEGEVDLVPLGTTSLNVPLQRGASLVGQVTDETGRPREGVWVRLAGFSYPQRFSVATDGDGSYRIGDLPGGELSVSVDGGEHGKVKTTLQIAAGQEHRWDPVLQPGLHIRGVLEDERGRPLQEWWILDGRSGSWTTDSRGRFLLGDVEDRPYTLDLYRKPWGPVILSLEGVTHGTEEQTFTVPDSLMPSAWIRGRVLTPEGRPAEGAGMGLWQGRRSLGGTPESGEDGRFEIGPLSPGTYRLRVGRSDYAPAEYGEITLVANQVAVVGDGRLRHGARLEVTLESSGPEQLEGLRVRVVDGEGTTVERGGVQGTSVSFRLLPPGTHFLSVEGPNVSAQRLPIELKPRETLSLDVNLR